MKESCGVTERAVGDIELRRERELSREGESCGVRKLWGEIVSCGVRERAVR